MLISRAYAQAVDIASNAADMTPVAPPSAMEAFMWNMSMVLVLVALFYLLLIRPQQKRFKEHSEMLQGLNKGDPVVTGGGLVGTVSQISKDKDEVIVDLGNGIKVTAIKGSLQTKNPAALSTSKPANDSKTEKKKDTPSSSKSKKKK